MLFKWSPKHDIFIKAMGIIELNASVMLIWWDLKKIRDPLQVIVFLLEGYNSMDEQETKILSPDGGQSLSIKQ